MSFILYGARHTMSIFASEFTDNIGAIFASLGIALAGIVVAWIMIKLGECCTGAHSSKRWEYDKSVNGAHKWKEKTSKSSHSIIRLITMGLALLVATCGLWIAAQTAGFNFWTVVLGYGILSLIGTYAFGGMLRDIGAFFLLSLTDKIEDGYYIEVVGLGVEGRITAIHWLWVEVEYINPKTENVVEIQIPTGFIMMNVIKRKFSYEKGMINYKDKDPTDIQKAKARIGHRLKPNKMVEV